MLLNIFYFCLKCISALLDVHIVFVNVIWVGHKLHLNHGIILLQWNKFIKLTHSFTHNPSIMNMHTGIHKHADTQLWSFMMTVFLVSCFLNMNIFPCLHWSRHDKEQQPILQETVKNTDWRHQWSAYDQKNGTRKKQFHQALLKEFAPASYGKLWSYGSSCVRLAVITVLWLCSYGIQ